MRWFLMVALILAGFAALGVGTAQALPPTVLPPGFQHPPLPNEPKEPTGLSGDNPYAKDLKVAKDARRSALVHLLFVEKTANKYSPERKQAYDAFMAAHNRYAKLCTAAADWEAANKQSLGGRVLLKGPAGAIPLMGAIVTLHPDKLKIGPISLPRPGYKASSRINGSFGFASIATGGYSMTVEKSGFLKYEKRLDVARGSKLHLEVYMTPLALKDGNFSGQVLSKDGKAPINGAEVVLRPVRILDTANRPPAASYKALTTRNGSFRISELPPGSYTVAVTRAGYHSIKDSLELKGASDAKTSYYLSAAGALKGNVIAARLVEFNISRLMGSPPIKCSTLLDGPITMGHYYEFLAKANVALTSDTGKFRAVTDAKGDFELSAVPSGSYEIVITKEKLCPYRGKIEVKEPESQIYVVLVPPYYRTCTATPAIAPAQKQAAPAAAPSGQSLDRPFEQ